MWYPSNEVPLGCISNTPTPPSPTTQHRPVFYPTVDIGPFEYLFAAPPCLLANGYPYQYTVHYKQGCYIWFSAEELVNSWFLDTISQAADLHDATPPFFITPFHTDAHHSIHIHSDSMLPLVHICTKVGKHLWSLNFPFGYIKTTFLDLIKFVFSHFPSLWLSHFKGALVPLIIYNFLDSCTAILCGHLHFTEQGILLLTEAHGLQTFFVQTPSSLVLYPLLVSLLNHLISLHPP